MSKLKTTEFITGNVKALAGEDWKLEVLGAPYGGVVNGRDKQGEYFSDKTEFGIEIGAKIPVYYFHGLTPQGKLMKEELPEIIGNAVISKRDAKGLWFEVVLNQASKLAKRVWEAALKGLAKASTGAIDHLVRFNPNGSGEILNWTLGELSLLDEGLKRFPANQLAVVIPAKAKYIVLDSLGQSTKTVEVQVDDKGNYNDVINQIKINESNGEYNMENEENVLTMEEVLEALDAREAAKAEKEAGEKELRDALKAEVIEELKDNSPNFKAMFNTKKLTDLGNSNDENNSFWHWVKTGDGVPFEAAGGKKALTEGSATAGGYLVPDDFHAKVIEKRDAVSWVREAGVRVMQTSRDKLNIPTEDSATTNFVISGEGAGYDEDDVTLAQVAVSIYKFTKMTKISEELLADQAANLEEFLASDFGRKMGLTENAYVAVGTGSSQPEGVTIGGTAGLTFDGASAITADEVPELFYKLKAEYRQNATWLMNGTTEAYLRGIRDANNWAFGINEVKGQVKWNSMLGRPVVNDSNVAEIGSGNITMLIGDFNFYALVERAGLVVSRNPYRYEELGLVGIFAHFRFGGAVLQAEAFQFGTQA